MLGSLWFKIATIAPFVSRAGTSKVLKEWPDKIEGFDYDPSVVIVFSGEENAHKLDFRAGYVNLCYIDLNNIGSLKFNIGNMTGSYDPYGGKMYPLTMDYISDYFLATSISEPDAVQIAEGALNRGIPFVRKFLFFQQLCLSEKIFPPIWL